jgi:hypothetical protein
MNDKQFETLTWLAFITALIFASYWHGYYQGKIDVIERRQLQIDRQEREPELKKIEQSK